MQNDITLVETAWGDWDTIIHINRDGEGFKEAAQALSDFIRDLRLPADQNDELIRLAVNMVNASERATYTQGFSFGLEIGQTPDEQEVDFE